MNGFAKITLLCLLYCKLSFNVYSQTNINKYGVNGTIEAIDVDNEGNTFIGGSFSSIGLKTQNGAVVDSLNGFLISENLRINGIVYTSVPTKDCGWYIGGEFSRVNETVRNNFAKINSDGTLSNFVINTSGSVRALAIDNEENLYIGGFFQL